MNPQAVTVIPSICLQTVPCGLITALGGELMTRPGSMQKGRAQQMVGFYLQLDWRFEKDQSSSQIILAFSHFKKSCSMLVISLCYSRHDDASSYAHRSSKGLRHIQAVLRDSNLGMCQELDPLSQLTAECRLFL